VCRAKLIRQRGLPRASPQRTVALGTHTRPLYMTAWGGLGGTTGVWFGRRAVVEGCPSTPARLARVAGLFSPAKTPGRLGAALVRAHALACADEEASAASPSVYGDGPVYEAERTPATVN